MCVDVWICGQVVCGRVDRWTGVGILVGEQGGLGMWWGQLKEAKFEVLCNKGHLYLH